MKKNKWNFLISCLIILLPAVFAGKVNGSWLAVIILLGAHILVNVLMIKDPENKNQSKKVMTISMYIIPVISLVMFVVDYLILAKSDVSVTAVMILFFGILFIVLGNYMPKIRKNSYMGVKVPWTLNNEENWNQTHRFTGKLWVAGGILILLDTLIQNMAVFMVILILLAFIPVFYSYRYYRKQIAAGTYTENFVKPGKRSKAVVIIPIVILAAVVVLLFTGKIEIKYEQDSFKMESTYYGDLEVSYDQIKEVEFREEAVPGQRISGFGSPKLSMGHFENEEFGTYLRYTYTQCDAAVVIRTEEETIVISGKDQVETEAIYEEIKERSL